MKEQNKPLLYRSSEIKEEFLPGDGEHSEHLILFRFESGSNLIGAETFERVYRGISVDDGTEAGQNPGNPILRIYQGLKSDTAKAWYSLVYKSYERTRRSRIGGEAILRLIDGKILRPEAKPTPLRVVEDRNWGDGYKCTPEVMA